MRMAAVYTIEQIREILSCKGQIVRQDAVIRHLLTDSRNVIFGRESLFFALPGPQHDGHTFVAQAYAEGVRNFVVRALPEKVFADANFLLVEDTIAALQKIAAAHRAAFHIPVLGITGSNGKTIVKEWLYQLLRSRYDIVRSPKSYNSQIGVPLSVWSMDAQNELAIFEAGISLPDEMAKLEHVIKPQIGIITNITDTHSEGFADKQQKTKEKLLLFADADVIIYRKEHALIDENIPAGKKTMCWSTERSDADIYVRDPEYLPDQTLFTIVYGAFTLHFRIPFADAASFENAMHAISAALYIADEQNDLDALFIEELTQAAGNLQPVSMRLEIKKGIHGCLLINDAYSADIDSLAIALHFLKQQSGTLRRTAILGEFDDSGLQPEVLFARIAALLKENGVTRLITIGEKWQAFAAAFSSFELLSYTSADALLQQISALHFYEEIILIKGARRLKMEQISTALALRSHGTELQIHLHHLAHNLQVFRAHLDPGVKTMAMVKAFSYGSGQAEIARTLAHQRVDYLAVAYADEGVDLRKQGIRLPIMVMNPEPDTYHLFTEYNLEPEVYSMDMLRELHATLRKGTQLRIHVKLDTGMHRLGFYVDALPELLAFLLEHRNLEVVSVFSHLAAADAEREDDFTFRQIGLFDAWSKQITALYDKPVLRHMLNSPGIGRFPNAQFDMVRLGIGLYGVDPSGVMQKQLLPVGYLYSTISQIKEIEKGDTVGYGRSFTAENNMRIATINIGYADGFSRRMGNGTGSVFLHGKEAPVLGRICMDMCMVDVTEIPEAQAGDRVEIFGDHISIEEVARRQETIAYEIMTGVSQRVKRTYIYE
ncbi:MAG: bifunctional UDP-N-acetylmuramoyl-tripeptide:D-alanyl-D-alanine ligase/alanine racemase [Chitinophagales bacterium]